MPCAGRSRARRARSPTWSTVRLEAGRFTPVELARVLLGLLDAEGRDAAWAAMTRDAAERHVRLWTDAVQRAPDDLVAAPAAVLGLAAWLAGHGALAWCAVDRCQAVDPGNTPGPAGRRDARRRGAALRVVASGGRDESADPEVTWVPSRRGTRTVGSRRSCWSSTRPRAA